MKKILKNNVDQAGKKKALLENERKANHKEDLEK